MRVLVNERQLPVKKYLLKKMAAQGQSFQILQIWYQIQQEEDLASVETNVQIRNIRLQNIANLYIQLYHLIQAVNQAPVSTHQKIGK